MVGCKASKESSMKFMERQSTKWAIKIWEDVSLRLLLKTREGIDTIFTMLRMKVPFSATRLVWAPIKNICFPEEGALIESKRKEVVYI